MCVQSLMRFCCVAATGTPPQCAEALGSAAPLYCLLSQVRRWLSSAGEPKVRNKLEALLQHAARGVAQNPTASPADVLLFCHSVLSDGAPRSTPRLLHSPFCALRSSGSCCTFLLLVEVLHARVVVQTWLHRIARVHLAAVRV